MKRADFHFLQICHKWLAEGHSLFLCTVTQTWGSSPRPIGSLAAIRNDGILIGSVSGGCVEELLIEKLTQSNYPEQFPTFIRFGDTPATQHLLPCSSILEVFVEYITDANAFRVVNEISENSTLLRSVEFQTGASAWHHINSANSTLEFEKTTSHLKRLFTQSWKLVLFGNNTISQNLKQFAEHVGFRVTICDPRCSIDVTDEDTVINTMPDDFVLSQTQHGRIAYIALSHDPKIDDMALMEALRTNAFYIGAIGSRSNSDKRRHRLAELDLSTQQIERLHAPVGLPIGSKTPEEIAISILAHVIQEKNRFKMNSSRDENLTSSGG